MVALVPKNKSNSPKFSTLSVQRHARQSTHASQPTKGLRGSDTSGAKSLADEAAVRDMTCAYLESKGYTVLEASNAKEALNIGKSHQGPIHVLITDMVMPEVPFERSAQKTETSRT